MPNLATAGGEIDLSSFFSEMPIWPTLLAKLKSTPTSGGNWATGGGPIGFVIVAVPFTNRKKIKKRHPSNETSRNSSNPLKDAKLGSNLIFIDYR